MAARNKTVKSKEKTHEGARVAPTTALKQLTRAVLACMLWEKTFYESGESIATRLNVLVPQVPLADVHRLAVAARHKYHIRHAPLLLAVSCARHTTYRMGLADLLPHIIQRADDLTEFLALYWADGKVPLAAQVKKGLASAFYNFDEYQLAKYDRAKGVKLRDAMRMVHPVPRTQDEAAMWKRLLDGTMAVPDTWETQLSSGADKKATFERLMREGKLGGLAFLRNLRNMKEAGCDAKIVTAYCKETQRFNRVLPFRYIAAARYAPPYMAEPLEQLMLHSARQMIPIPGDTSLVVDVSGSMAEMLSDKSEMSRFEAAAALAIIFREQCENARIYAFADTVAEVPNFRGLALGHALTRMNVGGGTDIGNAVKRAQQDAPKNRIVVVTDGQSWTKIPDMDVSSYIVNVAAYQNSVGQNQRGWTEVNGWSEAVFDYIREMELIG